MTEDEIKNQTQYINWYEGSVSSVKIVSSSSQSGIQAITKSRFNDMFQWAFSAELTIWGEYSKGYAPGDYLDIVVLGAGGVKHYASGVYMILEMTDTISSEGYIQSMKLFKFIKSAVNGTTKSSGEYVPVTIMDDEGNIHDGSGIIQLSPSGGTNTESNSEINTTPSSPTGGGGGFSVGGGGDGSFGGGGGRWPEVDNKRR